MGEKSLARLMILQVYPLPLLSPFLLVKYRGGSHEEVSNFKLNEIYYL
jgi:hypothetical protein